MNTQTTGTGRQHIVVIGAGFGGLSLAKHLDKKKWKVTIIDKHNYHSFAPLFYQVASSGLEPADITFPVRREMRKRGSKRFFYDMGKVLQVDVQNKVVKTDMGEVAFDILVIAAGTTNNYFGIEGLKENVYTIKSVPEAIKTRNAILDALERASQCADAEKRRKLLTFGVVGGGPTGVEIAGALGEMKQRIIGREYPRINPDEVRVILYEGSDRLLRTMSAKSSADALRDLQKMGVEVQLGRTLKDYTGGELHFADGTTTPAGIVIWTAGVVGHSIPLAGTDVTPGPGGRFIVDEYNRVKGLDDVYAIGDISLCMDDRFPRGCPQLAQPAIQQGRRVALNLNAPEKAKPFDYHDKGSMATIGRHHAVVDMGKMHIGGYVAWLAWMFVHLITILGMRNKATVLINWMWNYFGLGTSLRMILKPSKYPLETPKKHRDEPEK